MKKLLILSMFAILLSGCATSTPISQGMTKDEVKLLWGSPNSIKTSQNSCCKERNQEVWHYFRRGIDISDPNGSVLFEDEIVRAVVPRW